jgi:hypothetical protein
MRGATRDEKPAPPAAAAREFLPPACFATLRCAYGRHSRAQKVLPPGQQETINPNKRPVRLLTLT